MKSQSKLTDKLHLNHCRVSDSILVDVHSYYTLRCLKISVCAEYLVDDFLNSYDLNV